LIKNILYNLTKWSRTSKQLFMILIDSVALVIILLASFSLRLGFLYFPEQDMFWAVILAPVIGAPIFYFFRLYRLVVRYIGLRSLWDVVQAISLYSAVWGLIIYMLALDISIESVEGIPRSVILINWMLAIIVIGGLRIFAYWFFTSSIRKKNVIIYGAGSAGRQLSVALTQSDEYKVVCFIDDQVLNQNHSINGIEVYPIKLIEKLISQKNISEVLIAIPSLSRIRRREIIESLEPYQVIVRSLPSLAELVRGELKIDDLREIDIKDLLGRASIKPNNKLLKVKIVDKVVLITGAGGSIGTELSRQILSLKPKKLILFEVSEAALYQIEQDLVEISDSNVEILPILGSVRYYTKLEHIFKQHGVQTVYHAAAYKHVPLVEHNQSEGVLNNAIGTWRVAEAAITSAVETFVLISSDKAVRPTNTMGASKRVSELILQGLSKNQNITCFSMVRFGNVLDSSGSVIPLFKKQIKSGGPVTVTDKKIVRYFMTVQEAVELVIQAGAMGTGGDVFVLDMGSPILIKDLAEKIIRLSGLQVKDELNPNGDIEIQYIGLRPGEKLYEELLVGENVTKTENALIMRAEEMMMDWESLKPKLIELEKASINLQNKRVRDILLKLVPEFDPKSPSNA
jgi:FlaA1/EpsC-like NDP-sugar epimerase